MTNRMALDLIDVSLLVRHSYTGNKPSKIVTNSILPLLPLLMHALLKEHTHA